MNFRSTIKEKFPLIRKCVLLLRRLKVLLNKVYKTQKYTKLQNDEYNNAITLALIYTKHARVEGDIVEFGAHGVTAAVICKFLAYHKSKRSIHTFDSFKGYPKATLAEDLNSYHIKTKVWKEGDGLAPISAAKLNKKLQKWIPSEQVKIYEGWFDKTVKTIPKKTKFAMVLMDCNMYESSFTALDYLCLNGMISEGAIILFSDWNVNRSSSDFSSRRVWKEVVSKFEINHSSFGSYSWGGQRFIIHSYKKIL